MQRNRRFKRLYSFCAFTSLPCYKAMPGLDMRHDLHILPGCDFTCELKRILMLPELR